MAKVANAIINSEGKSQKAYMDANQSLADSRQKILDVAAANGLNRDQVSALLDQIMKIGGTSPSAKAAALALEVAHRGRLSALIEARSSG